MIVISTHQTSIHIPDLNLYVTKLNPITITLEQYRSSKYIVKLESMGLISCANKNMRTNMSKDPPKRAPIRTAKFSRPNKGGLVKPASQSVKPSQPRQQNTEEMIRKASEEAAKKAVKEVEDKLLQTLTANLSQNQAPNLEDAVQKAILSALGNLNLSAQQTTGPAREVSTGPEDPLYIPSNIVDKNLEGNVNVKSESSTSEGIEDAASQLRAMRKSKNKKEK
jgi:hypothetical protein